MLELCLLIKMSLNTVNFACEGGEVDQTWSRTRLWPLSFVVKVDLEKQRNECLRVCLRGSAFSF